MRLLAKIWKEGIRYKKAGIMLLDLVPASKVQAGLLHPADDQRSQARMAALDALNARFGRDTVSYAASGTKRSWMLRSDHMSARYTTNWDELLSV